MAFETRCTRRRFLTGMVIALTGPVVARCGGVSGPSAEEIKARARSYDPDLVCTETKGLWPAELSTRTDNEYSDSSTQPGQYCFICNNFEEPKVTGTCGTCTTVKGPIQPLGWCKAWTERR